MERSVKRSQSRFPVHLHDHCAFEKRKNAVDVVDADYLTGCWFASAQFAEQ